MLWQQAFEVISDAILIWDTQGNIVKRNPAASQLSDAVIRATTRLNFYQAVQSSVPATHKNALNIDMYVEPTKQWFSVSMYVFEVSQSQQILCILHDISQRKAYENQLLSLTDQYRQLVDHMPDGVLIIQDLKLMFANPTMLNMMHVENLDLAEDKTAFDFIHPDDQQLIQQRMRNTLQGIPNPSSYVKVVRPDGTCFPACISSSLITVHDKPAIQAVIEDLTVRREQEKKLATTMAENKQLLNQLSSIIEQADIGIIIHRNERVLFVNPYVLTQIGISSAKLMNNCNIFTHIHPDDQADVQQRLHHVMQDKASYYRSPVRYLNSEGETLDSESTSMPITYEGELAVLSLIRDVTDIKANERELQYMLKMNQQLAQRMMHVQEQERLMLARNLHDESGQLLTAISANLVSIKDQSKSQLAQDRLQDTQAIVTRLFSMIRLTLEDLNPTYIESIGLRAAVQNDVARWSHRHGIRVETHFCAEIDLLGSNAGIAIFHIVQEAMTNIAKHAGALRVWIRMDYADDENAQMRLSIRDNGCGFDTSSITHTGLGLFNMQARAAQMMGTFHIQSNSAIGTILSIDFALSELIAVQPKQAPGSFIC